MVLRLKKMAPSCVHYGRLNVPVKNQYDSKKPFAQPCPSSTSTTLNQSS